MVNHDFSTSAPPTFIGSNYRVWAVKMRSYLKAFDFWDIVENGELPVQRHANPTIAQIKQRSKELTKRAMKTDYVENTLVAKTKELKLKGSGFKNGESKGNKSGKKSGEVKQGTVNVETDLGIKCMNSVHYVLDANHNLLNVEFVKDLPRITKPNKLCQACQFGKQTKNLFPKENRWKVTNTLELVHTVISGPMKTSSLNGSKYYIIFINDFTKYCWIFFIKHKSNALNIFRKFKASVKNFSGMSIKTLRSDNGREYVVTEFEKYLEVFGVHHQLTISYNPQQNGKAERKNKTLAEMDMKTPYEMWFGHKPTVSHLRTFKCVYYAMVPNSKRTKLDPKSVAIVLVGYSKVSKGYKLYDVKLKKIFVNRDMIFNNGQSWNWKNPCSGKAEVVPPANENLIQNEADDDESDLEDESKAIRGTWSLSYIYNRCNVAIAEPSNFKGAYFKKHLKSAMDVEMQMIKNGTWKRADRPVDKNVIKVKWIYRTKLNPDGSINKYKAQLVVKGYAQVYGVDYMETIALGTLIYVENSSAIARARNPIQHGRIKHIRDKYHAFREFVKDNLITLQHCPTEDQVVDIFTKSLGK
ncbi:Uncharacterized protein TCM_040335 [Theobroma cacao]|uniref:Integrase catalytic domain-containing protein n=1 Tax=Theobroma cacao TaxID=3641 RepID=A0A061GSN1_THECC|nr:Uncharacterized protein TCM_040335 [Theobroma cacao]